MKRVVAVFFISTICFIQSQVFAQMDDPPLKIFGYFQNSFQHWTAFVDKPKQNSFSLQQLNLFLQKDFNPNWTAFVNFEFLNNFSTNRKWGSANLEEAWIKYRANMKFNLKLGLLIPIFNNFNEIKNRTPLLPYIIRPLAYETSFSDFIPVEVFTPSQAFVQVYGFFPKGKAKFDYAVYLGNSPNIRNNPLQGQTGIDTTSTFLVGGRLGLRYRELKMGISATYDKDNIFNGLVSKFYIEPTELNEIPKTRFGGDLSYDFANFSFESEFIKVDMKNSKLGIKADLDFIYSTLGYHITDKLFIYSSFWVMDEHLAVFTSDFDVKEDGDVSVYTLGASYGLMDRVSLKAQFSRVINKDEVHEIMQNVVIKDKFSVFALAVSVFF
jgi:hypothetical protein